MANTSTLAQVAAGPSDATGVTPVSQPAAVLAVVGAGVVMVVLADPFPHLINGLLILILAGVVLNSSSVWAPWLGGVTYTFSNGKSSG